MKFEDLKEGLEVYVRVVVYDVDSVGCLSSGGDPFARMSLSFSGDADEDGDHSQGEIYFHKNDFHLLDVKPLTKAQRNAKAKERIAMLKKQLKQAESEIIK